MVVAMDAALPLRRHPRRVAMLSVHTSPLDQPGTGDAGGMNVYIVEVARRLAQRGIEVEVFTRATSSELPAQVEMAPGVLVHHVVAGPFEGLPKEDLPGQLCAVTAGVLRAEAARREGWYDLVHSHYWLSGQVGWLAKERWGVPLVHSMHTMARVKNLSLAPDDRPEPELRIIGEQQVVEAADRLVANTADERAELVALYDADPSPSTWSSPASTSTPSTAAIGLRARAALGYGPDDLVVLFVGRIQPLKAPDVLVRAMSQLATPTRPWPPGCAWSLRRAVGLRDRAPHRAGRPGRRAATCPPRSTPPADRAAAAPGTPPRTSSSCPRTPSRSAWSPSRPRPAGPRCWPPTSAVSRWPSATASPGCSWTATSPSSGRPPCVGPDRRRPAGAPGLRGPRPRRDAVVGRHGRGPAHQLLGRTGSPARRPGAGRLLPRQAAVANQLAELLEAEGLEPERPEPHRFVVVLPGHASCAPRSASPWARRR